MELLGQGNDSTSSVSVGATNFMAYHTVLREPQDYVDALKLSRHVADHAQSYWNDIHPVNSIANNTIFPYRYPHYLYNT